MINTRKTPSTKQITPGVQRSYNEIAEYLDSRWKTRTKEDLVTMKALDKALGNPSKDLKIALIGGTNGKGLTVHFASTLLKNEGYKVGAFYTPHTLTYNEQFVLNNESISNKTFTEIANEVINTAEINNLKASTLDILAAIALVYFKQQNVDIALLEMRERSGFDPFTICSPKVVAITRVTDNTLPHQEKSLDAIIKDLLVNITSETHIVSADQSKANLQVMIDEAKRVGATWAMPIRKLATLNYPFEQLHGRCAALAERICQIFVDEFIEEAIVTEHSLLIKQKGQRGRPTLEAKRHAELNPKKTLEQFWKETTSQLPARFQLLDKEKPSILLDVARNVDALENLLLGIRLMHYQRPLKGLAFIFACDKNLMNTEEFLKLLRYFTKKNSATIIFCPISEAVPGLVEKSWDVEQITNDVKSLKIKAKSAANFQEAFDLAKQSVDERHGLIVISGSQSIIAEYWHNKGIKKL